MSQSPIPSDYSEMRERFTMSLILVEIASAIVLSVFGLLGMFVLIGAHKSAEIVALFSFLSVLLTILFMGLIASLMWIIYRRAVQISTISQ